MSQTQYFRSGAGSVIYNEAGEIAVFRREDNPDIWQLQQGGMDAGEEIEETLWREVKEETGLIKTDFSLMTEYPHWLSYAYGKEQTRRIKDLNCRGQIHRWFFLKLTPGVEIDLATATDKEFVAVEWSTFPTLLARNDTLKKDVYTVLAEYFEKEVRGT